jgi:hypothetical protein
MRGGLHQKPRRVEGYDRDRRPPTTAAATQLVLGGAASQPNTSVLCKLCSCVQRLLWGRTFGEWSPVCTASILIMHKHVNRRAVPPRMKTAPGRRMRLADLPCRNFRASGSQHARLPPMEGLRGLAVTLVFLQHYTVQSQLIGLSPGPAFAGRGVP